MPKYKFHFVPQDGKGDVYLTYAGDDEALSEARRALHHIGWFERRATSARAPARWLAFPQS
jgi:hypothetical protein